MKKLIHASEDLVKPSDLSKERLETLVSQIADIINRPSMGSSMQLVKIIAALEFYGLKKRT
jgi:hypothetical protein